MAFPRLIGEAIEAFCDRLVREAGVLLLPGTLFDVTGGYFRLGFGRKNLPEALGVLEEYLGEESSPRITRMARMEEKRFCPRMSANETRMEEERIFSTNFTNFKGEDF